jgi:RIO-like serine/threonine protein kinase
MQGANSKVLYFRNYIIKEVTDDEKYGRPLDVAASREVYLMTLARTGYKFIPRVISLSGTRIKMERLTGVTLGKYIRANPTTENYTRVSRETRRVVRSLLEVNVYHGDVTHENIIVDPSGRVWIVDFGRARYVCPDEDEDQLFHDQMFVYFDTLDDLLQTYELDNIIPKYQF